MIGRRGEVRPFDLIRWARKQATVHSLKPVEAQVLLLLATYANKNCIAWPSIKTLALDSGRTPTRTGTHSAISAALSRLEDVQLVWTEQAGKGHPAKRELLFNPEAEQSTPVDGVDALPSTPVDVQPSTPVDEKYQGNGHSQVPEEQTRGSHPLPWMASHPEAGMAEDPTTVRALIEASLTDAQRRNAA